MSKWIEFNNDTENHVSILINIEKICGVMPDIETNGNTTLIYTDESKTHENAWSIALKYETVKRMILDHEYKNKFENEIK